jgi:predicted protein tyrosine phosphatase
VAHPSIRILGYSEAAMFLRSANAADLRAILSIHGEREQAVTAPDALAHHLVLRFDDADSPDDRDLVLAYRTLMQRRRDELYGRPLTPPAIEDARAIIEFARTIERLDGTLLCQCHAGVSRSPAAALLCLATWTGAGQERACVEEVLLARPCAAPHRSLTAYGDTLLGRDGALTRAVTECLRRH